MPNVEELDFVTCDGMAIKQISLPTRGTLVPQHAHLWDHSTLLARGSIIVWQNARDPRRYVAPAVIWIPAGISHEFQTLEPDCLIYCLHNLHGDQAIAVLAEHGLEDWNLDRSAG